MLCDDAAYTRVRVCNVAVRSIVTLSSMSLSWGGDDEKPFFRPIRPCLVCLLVVQQAVAATAAMPTHLEYNVLRNGEPAGQHVTDFKSVGDSLQAQISTNVAVKMAFITCVGSSIRAWSGGARGAGRVVDLEDQ